MSSEVNAPAPTPRSIWAVLALSLVAKFSVVWMSSDVALVLDEKNYVEIARFLLTNGHFENAFRPPMYPAFIALCQAIGGDSATPVRIGHALVSTGAGWVLYRWLRSFVGHRGAALSTTLWCLYPTLVGFTHLLWSETIFLSLLIGFFALALTPGAHGLKRTAGAGVVFGLAALTRSVLLPFLPVAPLFVMAQTQRWKWRPGHWLRGAVFVGAVACTVAPWSIHNRVVTGDFVINDSIHGYNLWKGNTAWEHPHAKTGPQYPGPFVSIPMFPYEGSGDRLTEVCAEKDGVNLATDAYTQRDVSECAQGLAIDNIVSDPLAFLSRGPVKLGVALHPSNLLLRHLWMGNYGSVSAVAGKVLIWGTALAYLALLFLIGVAIRRVPKTPLSAALGLLALYQLAVIFITFGNTRFRLPVMLVGMVMAAWSVKAEHPE